MPPDGLTRAFLRGPLSGEDWKQLAWGQDDAIDPRRNLRYFGFN